MREIKFRAWDKEGKKWFIDLSICIQVKKNGKLTCFNDGIVMQFTGLKDCKGREIYEGDMVQADYYRAEVKYENGYPRASDIRNGCICDLLLFRGCEIIGNIYENPELLKEAK